MERLRSLFYTKPYFRLEAKTQTIHQPSKSPLYLQYILFKSKDIANI